MEEIRQAIIDAFEVDILEIKKHPTTNETNYLWVFIFYAYEKKNIGYERIGAFLSGRKHSTIIHAINRFNDLISIDEDLQRIYRGVRDKLFENECKHNSLNGTFKDFIKTDIK